MTSILDEVAIEPAPIALREIMRTAHARATSVGSGPLAARSLDDWKGTTRRELGLSTDGPVAMAGHHAAFWHPGIVAKSLLVHALTAGTPGAAAHVVVEHDVEPLAALAVPVRTPEGDLARTTVAFLRQPAGAIAASLPTFAPADVPALSFALPEHGPALAAVRHALEAHRREPNAAMQVTKAAFELLAPLIPCPVLVSPAALLRTSLATAILDVMARDPATAAHAYNAVVLPRAAAAPLRILDDRVEVPLWRIDAEGRRLRAWDDDLERFREGSIALQPRALLMTGLLRLAACDLFVHGRGGIAYDVAMEQWFAAWLGVAVAPVALTTATTRLRFPESGEAPADPARETRAWRRAWFDPESLDESGADGHGPGPVKQDQLATIAALPRGTPQRRAAWRAMHERLEGLRASREAPLARQRSRLDRATRADRMRPIVEDRTWSFPLHGLEAMGALRDSVQRL